jgi:hypothetical protein
MAHEISLSLTAQGFHLQKEEAGECYTLRLHCAGAAGSAVAITYWTSEKIARYRDEALQIHDAFAEDSTPLAKRLLGKIEVYHA